MKSLTDESLWESRHAGQRLAASRPFRVPSIFRQQHAILKNVLPTGSDVQTLEVGCFPGGFLEYFHRELGHSVTGLEYVKDSCKQCRKILEDRHVPSTILHGDLFKDDWNTDQSVWDVVFSAGLIEHFDDSSPAIERHLQLVAPGGHCVITLPNHSGLLGLIMKTVNRRMWEVHNRMCGEQVLDAFNRAPSSDRFELTCCRYAEHAGLWNCGVYDRLRAFSRPAFVVGRASGLIAERALRWVPNTKLMSPNIILVAKARF